MIVHIKIFKLFLLFVLKNKQINLMEKLKDIFKKKDY